jgi:hypothetical protein
MIPAIILVCVAGAPRCDVDTAVEYHTITVPLGSCGRDAQAAAAPEWIHDGKFEIRIVCGKR